MVDAAATITCGARAVTSLAPALETIEDCPQELADAATAVQRGYFTTAEDERLRIWFARYLTARAGLLEVIADFLLDRCGRDDEHARHRAFLVAYTAACLLVRAARFLVDVFAVEKLVQRKLNEAEPRYRIRSRQYTRIYRALTNPRNAWYLRQARERAADRWSELETLADDPVVGPVIEVLRKVRDALDIDPGRYVKARLRYRLHSMRRRR